MNNELSSFPRRTASFIVPETADNGVTKLKRALELDFSPVTVSPREVQNVFGRAPANRQVCTPR